MRHTAHAAEIIRRDNGDRNDDHGDCGAFETDRNAGDDVGRRTGLRGLGNRLHRTVFGLRVVLRDVNKGLRHQDPDDAAAEKIDPRRGRFWMHRRIDGEQPVRGKEKADDRQRTGYIVTAVERRHRVFVLFALDDHDADDRGKQTEGARDQREENAFKTEVRIQADAEDHCTDIFRRGGFEQIRTAAGAVADIVTDQVRDDRRIARIVFRNTGFDFTDEIGADVGGFSVNTAAELSEERDKRRAKAITDYGKWDFLRIVAERFQKRVQTT